ncbi:ribonuclease inhibitor isoform X2 [Alligator mississippiensis]|uniref:ribonuclease inhibitor isoform X2 n=1 Tax=Alligator mississippiensis TaxID=8496 RepID=UPI0028773E8E|nr:ribonuclease inhibitor isoform X2 [Alligator mississippiensis]
MQITSSGCVPRAGSRERVRAPGAGAGVIRPRQAGPARALLGLSTREVLQLWRVEADLSLSREIWPLLKSSGPTSPFKMDIDIECQELSGSRWTELVSSMKDCKAIRLDYCKLSRSHCEDLCSVLSTNQSLKELKLDHNELKDEGVEVLCKGLLTPSCNLELLWLENCNLTGACCESLRSVLSAKPSLTDLHLSRNKLDTSGGKVLCQGLLDANCKAQSLVMRSCELRGDNAEMLTSILSKATLKKLDISNNKLGDAAIKQLCQGLMDPNSNLQLLHLENCDITADSCGDLATVLSTKPLLLDLAVGKNNIGDAGFTLLCKGLVYPNCNIQKLCLDTCGMTADSCGDLATVLSTNPSLLDLALDNNNIGDVGLILLCKGLIHPKCNIQKLWLKECGLTSACCESLRSVLSTKQSLKHLEIGSNRLKDEGAKLICEGLLDTNCNLETIWLGESELTAACCDSLAAVIRTKQCLRYLGLDLNRLENEGVRKLCEAVRSPNCKLKYLMLYDIYWSSEVEAELRALEESKPGLKIIF